MSNYDFNREIDFTHWKLPPYREFYRVSDSRDYVYDKPLLIINNKYTREWSDDPVNFIPIDILDKLLTHLEDRYQVVYSRPIGDDANYSKDDDAMLQLDEYTMITEKHPQVLLFQDIIGEHTYNQAQLMLHANCENFISVHGGMSLLCSMFGPSTTNVILTLKGKPIKSALYPKISGATIKEAFTMKDFIGFCKEF